MEVLVVESNAAALEQLSAILAENDYEVHEASGVRDAISLLEQRIQVDIIVSELSFPTEDGRQFFRYLQMNQRLRQIPVVVCTTTPNQRSVMEAIELGAKEFIVKPIDEQVLLDKMSQALSKGLGAILVVEDDDIVRELLTRIVQREGYKALGARNGRVGLEILGSERVSMVISDIMMPEMDGLELLGIIKESHPGIPILMVTAKKSKDVQRGVVAAGADGFITKPFKNIEIAEQIARFLGS